MFVNFQQGAAAAAAAAKKESLPADSTFKVKHLSSVGIRDLIFNTRAVLRGKAMQPPKTEYITLLQLWG